MTIARHVNKFTYLLDASEGNLAAVVSAQNNYFQLKAPYRGQICQVTVAQTSGTMEGFTAEILDADATSIAEVTNGDALVDTHRVVDSIVVPALSKSGGYRGIANTYCIAELSPSQRSTQDHIWCFVTPLGTGTKNFKITLTIAEA